MQWHLKTFDICDLIPYEKNPRILSEREQRQLHDSLDRFGLVDKPTVNADNTIIGGHQRITILLEKGHTQVDCWVTDELLDEKQVEELNIRLNRNNGDWDYDILANDWDVGDLLTWGFDEVDLGLGKPEKPEKKVKCIISLEFSDKETMLQYMQQCEEIAQLSAAKMKVRG